MSGERYLLGAMGPDDWERLRLHVSRNDPSTAPAAHEHSTADMFEKAARDKDLELLETARNAYAVIGYDERAPQAWLDAHSYLASSPLYEDWTRGLAAPTSLALNETGRRYAHFANQLGPMYDLERPGKTFLQNHMRNALFAALVARRGDVNRVALAAPSGVRRAYGCISAVAAHGQFIPCHVQPAGNTEQTMPPDVVTVPLGTTLTDAIRWRKQRLYELSGRPHPPRGAANSRKRSDAMLYTIELLARNANGGETADIEEQYLDEATDSLLEIFAQTEASILNDDGHGGIII